MHTHKYAYMLTHAHTHTHTRTHTHAHTGGPGKGMHSRLYTRVLNQYAWVSSCSAFQSSFNNTGLIGINATCDPSHASDMLDVMCREMETVTRWVYWGVFIGVGTCVCWGVCVLQPKPRIRHAGCYVP